MSVTIANPRTGDDPPPSGDSVLALHQDPSSGRLYRVHAVYLRRGYMEAVDVADEWPDDAWDWIDEEPYWPEGWYEQTLVGDPLLIPLPEGSVLYWCEFPSFGVTETKEARQ